MDNVRWKDKNVFITGATGFLGSWLAKYLIAGKANVIALVRDWVNNSELLNGINYSVIIRGDVENYPLIERIINEYEIDTVFHLAAQTIVKIANNNPMSTFETNIKGTWNILEAARRVGSKVIVASSDKAYGDQDVLPYTETTPLQGRHPYDVSKSCADLLARAYFETYNLPVCITRCGNFYGPGDLNFNRIIPGTIKSILNNQAPIIRGDGLSVRDYFYIEDGAIAYLTLAECMDVDIFGEAFNFSNESQVTVLDLVNKIIELMGSKLKPIVLNKAPNEIAHQYLSAKKAREVLGWKPKFSLEQGLLKTIDYYGQKKNI